MMNSRPVRSRDGTPDSGRTGHLAQAEYLA